MRSRNGQKPAHAAAPLLVAWQQTVRRRAKDRAAVEAATGATVTFAELEARALRWVAEHATPAGELAGSRVVFGVPNGIRWLELYLGLVHAGAIAVPLDGAEPAEAQRRTAERIEAAFWWDGARLVPVRSTPRTGRTETCLLKLTSGSTGEPRALPFTAAQLLADGRNVTRTMGIRASDLNYALIPLGHSYGLGNLVLPLLAHGVPLVFGSAPLPQAIAADVRHWRPTVLPSVPAVVRALTAADVDASALASLRSVISAGAPLPAEVARAFEARFGRRVHAFYGSSETGGISYDRSGMATLRGGVGRALDGVTLRVLPGGRLEVSSEAVFTRGNRRRRGACGAWVPPDRVRLDERGELTLLGRRDTTVKIAGRRVALGEVAARLRVLSGVRDVWVGVHDFGELTLGAAVVADRSAPEIRAELLADTASWKIPRRLAVLPEFPLTSRGKLDTPALHRTVFGAARAG